ncbi:MAG: DUF3106 domain-containing protein [Verrucomicrobiota bacterium]|nr:DUF3106 domain-containing protein [Verrucomicrobiota bacterium]
MKSLWHSALLILFLLGHTSLAAEEKNISRSEKRKLNKAYKKADPARKAEITSMIRDFAALPPNKQKELLANARSWESLSEEEKESLRKEVHLQQLAQIAALTRRLNENHLSVPIDKQEAFFNEYQSQRMHLIEKIRLESQKKYPTFNALPDERKLEIKRKIFADLVKRDNVLFRTTALVYTSKAGGMKR